MMNNLKKILGVLVVSCLFTGCNKKIIDEKELYTFEEVSEQISGRSNKCSFDFDGDRVDDMMVVGDISRKLVGVYLAKGYGKVYSQNAYSSPFLIGTIPYRDNVAAFLIHVGDFFGSDRINDVIIDSIGGHELYGGNIL